MIYAIRRRALLAINLEKLKSSNQRLGQQSHVHPSRQRPRQGNFHVGLVTQHHPISVSFWHHFKDKTQEVRQTGNRKTHTEQKDQKSQPSGRAVARLKRSFQMPAAKLRAGNAVDLVAIGPSPTHGPPTMETHEHIKNIVILRWRFITIADSYSSQLMEGQMKIMRRRLAPAGHCGQQAATGAAAPRVAYNLTA